MSAMLPNQFSDDDTSSNYPDESNEGDNSDVDDNGEGHRDLLVIPQGNQEVLVEDEGAADNEEEAEANQTMKRNRISTRQIWNDNFYCVDVCEQHIGQEYLQLAQQQFGGGGTLRWLSKDKPHTRIETGVRVTKKRCSFHYVSGCPFVIRELFNTRTQMTSIEIGSIQHNDHSLTKKVNMRPGMPKFMQSVVLSSPTKLQIAPSKFVASARSKGFAVDMKMSTAIKRRPHRIRCPRGIAQAPPASTWGGVIAAFDLYKRERIANFNMHSVYVVGIECNAESGTLVAVLSTENMLLNAYRQTFWGNPIFFAADASYRLTQEKNGLYPVITTNLAMESKTIAYGIISHEHHKAQRFILASIKAEVERIVKSRTENGDVTV